MHLNLSAREAHGFPGVLPYYVIVALVVATGWYQVKQTQAKQLQSGNAQATPQMQAMTKVFPVVFGLISLGINSAATIYFVISNAWRIGQQHFVIGKMYEDAVAAGEVKPPPAKDHTPPKDSKETGGNGAGSKTPRSGPAKGSPGAKDTNSNGEAGRDGMSSGARRKKKRKR